MNQSDHKGVVNNSEEIYLKDVFNKIALTAKYIKSKWLPILIVSMFGGLLGLCYATFKKVTYKAVCTFVLEEAKGGGGLGQYAGLASLAGIDIGSGGGGGGIFQGDNILELYKSRTMIEKTLLSQCDFNGKNELLIDRYIKYNNLRAKWKDDNQLSHINFNGNSNNFNLKQDSIITNLTDQFNKKILNVTKPDKKLNIISVEVISEDELFSKCFTEKLVQNVNDFYVQTKTKNAYQTVQILQRQMDSVRRILNSSISEVASAIDAAPNANPQMSVLKVSSQKRQIDVQANTAIYSEIVKNLELEKISLRQEMPLIQIIDKPVLPLHKDNISKLISLFLGVIIGFFLSVSILIGKKFIGKL